MNSIRLLLADDHTLVRAGFRTLLQNLNGVQIVAEAEDGHEAIALAEAEHPDIVLMDIAMPRLNGLEAMARILETQPHVRVIILSMHPNEEYVLRALRIGAAGYLLKDADLTELTLALRSVTQGQTYLSPPISKQVTDYVRRVGEAPTDDLERLTPRQREVLQLIAEGLTNREIALALEISVKTVESHRTELMNRLDIHDIAGLVRYAIRKGIIQPDV
jgi:DNA-binding NarL/FixJ family response regulator